MSLTIVIASPLALTIVLAMAIKATQPKLELAMSFLISLFAVMAVGIIVSEAFGKLSP